MRVTYEMEFSRLCPVNEAIDHYELKVEAARIVKVEDILAAVDALPDKAFQEDITTTLAAKLGCAVTTIGYHSGVKTTCTA